MPKRVRKFKKDDRVFFNLDGVPAFNGTVQGYSRNGKVLVVWDGITEPGKVGKVEEKDLMKI